MDKKVTEYIDRQKSPQKEICQKLRKIILKTFPDISEKMKWGVPSYANGQYYFVSLKVRVNLGFAIKGLVKEEAALFEGSGKTVKHLEFSSIDDIDEKQIIKLLKLVGVR